MDKQAMKQIGVRIPATIYRKLKITSAKTGLSMQDIITLALQDKLGIRVTKG